MSFKKTGYDRAWYNICKYSFFLKDVHSYNHIIISMIFTLVTFKQHRVINVRNKSHGATSMSRKDCPDVYQV